ncbi:hypothetical protein M8C21_000704 [Ambrosia artemisiifolia]|uniref:Uncharacterized protein n=1 Tax=Ambrosia artemisiifolia TaxID=4212 RepID=A0AAD5BN06_AMBAR|nr:hypothetical protein M8C21_000704 [Ambrosia artemisiifolia]
MLLRLGKPSLSLPSIHCFRLPSIYSNGTRFCNIHESVPA